MIMSWDNEGVDGWMDAWMDGWMIEQDQGFIMNHSEHNITYLTVVEVTRRLLHVCIAYCFC